MMNPNGSSIEPDQYIARSLSYNYTAT